MFDKVFHNLYESCDQRIFSLIRDQMAQGNTMKFSSFKDLSTTYGLFYVQI